MLAAKKGRKGQAEEFLVHFSRRKEKNEERSRAGSRWAAAATTKKETALRPDLLAWLSPGEKKKRVTGGPLSDSKR